MSKQQFLELMARRGISPVAAAMAWATWQNELSKISTDEFEEGMKAASLALWTMNHLQETIQ